MCLRTDDPVDRAATVAAVTRTSARARARQQRAPEPEPRANTRRRVRAIINDIHTWSSLRRVEVFFRFFFYFYYYSQFHVIAGVNGCLCARTCSER